MPTTTMNMNQPIDPAEHTAGPPLDQQLVQAWRDHTGADILPFELFNDFVVDDINDYARPIETFETCYIGEFESPEEFAEQFCTEVGLIPRDLDWLIANAIDWSYVASQLGFDYMYIKTRHRTVHVFDTNNL